MDTKQVNTEHAVLTQIHRWYQLYEWDDRYIENQLDILTDNIFVQSTVDEGRGKAAYRERIAKLPFWKNAHHIQSVEIKRTAPSTLSLEMDILYQNVGYLPDNVLTNTHLHYSAILQEGLDNLPKFSEIIISRNNSEPAKAYATFQDQYPENRVKSLVHYWLFLIESRPKDVAHFKELLTDKIDLSLTSRQIQTSEELATWLLETDNQVLRSGHHIARFDLTTINDHEYEVDMEFEWRGYMHAQPTVELEARTLHHWVIVNDPSERFARIKSMKVASLKNFQPCTKETEAVT